MLDLLTDLMGAVPHGCEYAEARHVERVDELVAVRNGAVAAVESAADGGLGVRARVAGAWGFAGTDDVSPEGARRALERAIAVAAAQPRAARAWAASLAPEPPARGHWASPCEQDPFAVSLDDKLAYLLELDAALAGEPRIAVREASCQAGRTRWAFASTDGAACTQESTTCGAGMSALAVDGDEAQVRSHPSGHGGWVAQAGWEHVHWLDLPGHAPRIAAEAAELLGAPPCPEGERTLVIGAEQLALQIHESVGHAIELDRILDWEAAFAGTSWLDLAKLGNLTYGSELMNIAIAPTIPGGLGSFGYDDEGTPAACRYAVHNGQWVGVLAGRDSAAVAGLDYGGSVRAGGWAT